MDLYNEIKSINLEQIGEEIDQISNIADIDNKSLNLLGRKGKISLLLKQIKGISPDQRKDAGAILNNFKDRISSFIEKRRLEISREELNKLLVEESIDVTITSAYSKIEKGSLHPITIVLREICDFFVSMGFVVAEGPEVEDEYYNFEALNVAADHPARDRWDTYYLKKDFLLRTHTSSIQIRYMEKNMPPFRIIAPGRCYRYEAVDATHLDVFNQLEGLVVDKHIRFSDLKGVLQEAVRSFLGADLKTRFRPAYYPFVEPGADLDVECIFCRGKGCNICKFSGWIELIPCGMVHPQVFKNAGYNPDEVTGFAFGMGFDRMVMLKFNINDLRLLYHGDLSIMRQF